MAGARRITLGDVAERAGVTKAAVSMALSGAPGVSAATRERVRRLALELGYQPNGAARALRGARAGAVGMVIDRPASSFGGEAFFFALLAGVQSVLGPQQVSVMFSLSDGVEHEIATYRQWWGQSRVDGVLVVDITVDDPRLPLLRELGLPAVLVGAPADPGGHVAMAFDDAECMRTVVDHLVGLGHHRLARVSGMPGLVHTRIRDDAFRRAARRHGVSARIVRGDYSAAAGAAATTALLARADPPTAVVYDNDLMAAAGVDTLTRLGHRVPGDVSVVAWDDSPLCALLRPGVTALHRDTHSYGAAVASALLDVIAHRPVGDGPRGVPDLVVRGSTGPAATDR